MSAQLLLLIISIICFIIAAIPHTMRVKFEWVGMAFLVGAIAVGGL